MTGPSALMEMTMNIQQNNKTSWLLFVVVVSFIVAITFNVFNFIPSKIVVDSSGNLFRVTPQVNPSKTQ